MSNNMNENEENKCLVYDPYKGQFFYMTVDEAKDHVYRNPEIYTGDLVSSIVESIKGKKPCVIMQIKEDFELEQDIFESEVEE